MPGRRIIFKVQIVANVSLLNSPNNIIRHILINVSKIIFLCNSHFFYPNFFIFCNYYSEECS